MWRYRRVRRTTCIGVLSAALLGGLASVAAGFVLVGWFWLLIAGLLFITALKRRVWSLLPLIICGLIIGAWRGNIVATQLSGYSAYIGQKVTLRGVIKDDPADNKGQKAFRLQRVNINGHNLNGEVKASIISEAKVARGGTVQLAGTLRPGFSSYQAEMSFAKVSSVQVSHEPILALRDAFSVSVHAVLAEPAASLGLGFVIGQTATLPKDLDDNLKKVGLTHIVVASGYNLTILVRLSRRLFVKVSKYLTTVSSLGLMGGFLLVTGFSPSMTRAGLVTALVLWAWHYGRAIHPLVLILLAGAVTAFIDPVYIWSDIGWYLSFLSFAGVLLLAPLIQRQLFGKKEVSALPQVAIETLSAQIATLPVGLFIFGKLSVLALLANVLVVPFIPLAMLLTFIAGVAGMVFHAGWWIALPAQYLMKYMLTVINWLANISWAQIDLKFELSALLVLVSGITGLGLLLWYRLHYDYRQSTVID